MDATFPKHLICELTDRDFTSDFIPQDGSTYHVRKAARGVLVRDNTIALLHVTKEHYHKLPGGGVENGELPEEAFHREILEETGCRCIVEDYAGVILEYRSEIQELQVNYIYFARIEGEPGALQFEPGEIAEGYELKWYPVSELAAVMSADNPTAYEAKFIHKRDLAVLDFYRERLMTLT